MSNLPDDDDANNNTDSLDAEENQTRYPMPGMWLETPPENSPIQANGETEQTAPGIFTRKFDPLNTALDQLHAANRQFIDTLCQIRDMAIATFREQSAEDSFNEAETRAASQTLSFLFGENRHHIARQNERQNPIQFSSE